MARPKKLPGLTEAETGQLGVLIRHFFLRFFRNPLISDDGDWGVTLAEIIAPLAVMGVVACLLALQHKFLVAFVGDRLDPSWFWVNESFYLSLAMIVTGLVTLLEWDELMLDQTDYANLAGLPIRLRTLFLAKVGSLLLLVGLVSVGVNGLSALLFPSLLSTGFGSGLWWLAVHCLSLFAACLSVFCFCLNIQGLLLFLPGRAARACSLLSRWILVVTVFSWLVTLPQIHTALPALKRAGGAGLGLFPPMWFVGLYQTALGDADPVFRKLAGIALLAVLGGLLAAATVYAAQYRRQASGFRQSWNSSMRPLKSFPDWLVGSILRDPTERAVFHFTVQTMLRRHKQLLLWAGFSGLGMAVSVGTLTKLVLESGWAGLQRPSWLALSMVHSLVFFSLVGLRVVFSLPASLEANWVFKLSGASVGSACTRGVRKVALLFGAFPAVALGLAVHAGAWAWVALAHALYCVTLAFVLTEVLFFGFRKLPFACSFVPENANIKLMWSLYLIGLVAYVYGGALLENWILRSPLRFAVGEGLLIAAIAAWTSLKSRLFAGRLASIVYEERRQPTVVRIQLQ